MVHDITQIQSILETIGLSEDISVSDDISSSRLLRKCIVFSSQPDPTTPASKPSDKPCPFLVSFNLPQTHKDTLLNAKHLAKSSLKHLPNCPDLTKNQQKEDRQLCEEVKQLNAESPSDDKGSFLWKVVGTPGQPSWRKVKIYPKWPPQTA